MKVKDLFILHQGNGLELMHVDSIKKPYINFVSRTGQNNGVVSKVGKVKNIVPFPAGYISVALGGSVLSTFVQSKPFYTAFHIMVLEPKKAMKLQEKLYYCMCINANAYRYSYGRQANKTLGNINLPDEVPKWVYETKIKYIKTDNLKSSQELKTKSWEEIPLSSVFDIKKGKRLTKLDRIKGNIPFVTAGYENQGIAENIGNENIELFEKNITIDMFGNAFFRDYSFACDDNILVLIEKKDVPINRHVAIFIATIINMDKYRYAYGRQYRQKNFLKQKIKLPVTKEGGLDFKYMENYIKSLPFADRL